MKLHSLIALLIISANAITGFGATPSKPDFAYPKTVSKNARKELKIALKQGNGPDIVRATMDYGLAETEINPEAITDFTETIDEIKRQVNAPATLAMLDFVAADADNSDSLALATLNKYTDVLRATSVDDWHRVIKVDSKFTPTLYDFAILAFESLLYNDSIRSEAIAFNANNPYPHIFFELVKSSDFDSTLSVYNKFKGQDIEAYALSKLADQAGTIQQRTLAYNLCCESQSSLTNIIAQAKDYLTRSEVTISGPQVIKANEPFKVKLKATCVNEVRITIKSIKPTQKLIREISIPIQGSGVFCVEKDIELTLSEYGRYSISPSFPGNKTAQRPDNFELAVTDFLLTQQTYGSINKTMALDAVSGKLQNDVQFSVIDNFIVGRRGADQYSPRVYNQKSHAIGNPTITHANIFTDRAIYRPGDKLRFAATLLKATKNKRELMADSKTTISLYNANRILIDSLSVISDSYGRINGEFSIPKDGLTGYYRIHISGFNGSAVLVSDYKTPTFEVEMSAQRLDSNSVEVKGKAIGYNGFPIADAKVAIEIAKLPEWVWFRQYRTAHKTIITTDTVNTLLDGTFSAIIPVAEYSNLSAQAIISSPTGESHDAACFLPAKPYFIHADIPTYVLAGTAPKISVSDSEGQAVKRPYRILLTSQDNDIIEPNHDWSNIPSGAYTAKITSSQASDFTSETFYVYRTTDSLPPTESALFVPVKMIESGQKCLIGTSFNDSNILYTLWTPKGIIEQKWLSPAKGNSFMEINLPDSVTNATLTLFTLHNYEFSTENINVTRKDVPTSLKINIESLRNKITPGDYETWTIKVTDNLGTPTDAALILNLYSKALDALQPYGMNFYAPDEPGYHLSLNHPWLHRPRAYARNHVVAPFNLYDITASFQLYNQNWPRLYSRHYRSYGAVQTSMKAMNTSVWLAETGLDMAYATTEELAIEESAAEDAGPSESAPNNDIRMSEIPNALWAPVLNTDSAGQLQIQFTAPNATTTWAAKALAYNQNLLSGTFDADIISSKPVMVQPNLPRFMRIGDNIRLLASVINNTDSVNHVTAFFELFDPNTNAVVKKQEYALTLNPMRADIIAIDFTAPQSTMIGVRVKASSGHFTDGEQSILPILPNDISISKAQPIFLTSDSTNAAFEIPAGGIMTITANAVWECVAALPGLQFSESKSAFSATSALFSAATARGLMREHPAIAKAIHLWQHNDSALMSQLTKNDDLKIALLNSTPFVNAARSDAEQRARLLLLFDKSQTEQVIADATHNLAKLVKDGGLAWTENASEPSFWVTLRVMTTLAQLNRMGYLPKNDRLNSLITNAIKYLDNEVARQFAKNKDSRFIDYVLMRSQFPDIRQTAPAKRAAAATVQHLVGHWRDESLAGIAKAAIILNENNYPTTAHTLIESLRQHEVWKYAEINPYYLEAFAAIEPNAPEVDMIRSAYISRKHSMDWGTSIATSDLIAAILNSGTPWLIPAANELSISVNGKQLNIDDDNVMGEYRIPLPNGGKIEIQKGNFPTWGGIFSQSNDSIKAIEAFHSEDLKITQKIDGDMKVGSKVTLTITINANRDIDYAVVRQPRCAAFEPTNQLPSTLWMGYLTAYREPCSTETNWFFNRIAKGETVITETLYVTAQGTFALAPTEIQSQYAPEFKAHSAGQEITISE